MDIKNPRRILAVSLAQNSEQLSRVIRDLSGSSPTPEDSSLAGVTHTLRLKTAYYSASVPVWLDLVESPGEWAAAFLSPEAREVLAVLGGLVVVFAMPPAVGGPEAEAARKLVHEMGRVVREGLGGWDWDGVSLCVGVGVGEGEGEGEGATAAEAERWDDYCAEAGLEFVHVGGNGAAAARNEFGEKTGTPRLLEALEANDWALGSGGGGGVGLDGNDHDDEFGEFKRGGEKEDDEEQDEPDPENRHLGLTGDDERLLRMAVLEAGPGRRQRQGPDEAAGGEDEMDEKSEVEKIEGMMRKLQAVREAGEDMDEDQRRRVAAKAVAETMRDL